MFKELAAAVTAPHKRPSVRGGSGGLFEILHRGLRKSVGPERPFYGRGLCLQTSVLRICPGPSMPYPGTCAAAECAAARGSAMCKPTLWTAATLDGGLVHAPATAPRATPLAERSLHLRGMRWTQRHASDWRDKRWRTEKTEGIAGKCTLRTTFGLGWLRQWRIRHRPALKEISGFAASQELID
jgi:hypothetical protein